MPTTNDRSRVLAIEPADSSATFLRASLEANQNWAKSYFDGLEQALDFQRQLAESYVSAGSEYLDAAAAFVDRAARARTEVAQVVTQTVEGAARTQAELVSQTVDRATKTHELVTEAAEQAARTQAERVSETADRAAKTQERVTKAAEKAARTQAELVSETADRTAKTQERVTKAAEKAVKAQAEVVTGPMEEPLAGYDALTAEEIVAKLPAVSQRTLAKVGAYERAHQARTTVLARVESLTADEPAPGYGDLTVAEIQQLLNGGDEALAKRVRDYERTHAARSGVLQATERQLKQA